MAHVGRGTRYLPVRHAIGVDVSDVSVQLLELQSGPSRSLAIRSYHRQDLPGGLVRDGEILDQAALRRVLEETFQRASPQLPSTRAAIVALPESKVYLRAFEFPRTLTEEHVRRAIPFEAEGALPLTLDEVYYDIQFHRSRIDTHHVLFAAAPRRIVESYAALFTEAGFLPVAFEVESAALARSIVGARAEPVLVADIGGRASVISVIERELVHSAVTLSVAGNSLTEGIQRILRVSLEEAEQRKRRDGMTEQADARQREAVMSALAPLVQELRRTAQYHELHTGRAVGELLLAGGSAALPGLLEYLAAETRLVVRVGDPWSAHRIQLPPSIGGTDGAKLQAELAGALSTVVGLALRGVEREPALSGLNVLPPVLKAPHASWRTVLTAAVLAAATATTLLALAGTVATRALLRWFELREVSVQAAHVRAQLQSVRFSTAVATTQRVNDELARLSAFHSGTPHLAEMLAQLRSALPEGVAIQSLDVSVPVAVADPITASIGGTADRRETFLAFEQRLRSSPGVESVESPLSNLDAPAQVPFVLTLVLARSHP